MDEFVLGLDVGTTSISVVPVLADGTVLPGKSREHGAGLKPERPWESLQDVATLLGTAEELLEETKNELGSPNAIGVCSQMHGVVYLDEAGRPVSPLYTWLDGRGNLPVGRSSDDGRHDREAVQPSYAAHLSQLTGSSLSSGFGLVTHFVLQSIDSVPPRATAMVSAGDFVAMALTGRARPLMDPSQAHGFGAYDIAAGDWNRERTRAARVPWALLPEIAPSGTILGVWSASPGTRVTTCIGDNQASVLGAAENFRQDGILSLGTSGQISVHLHETASPHPAIEIRPFPAPGYLGVGASLTGGKAYQTLRDFYTDVCARFAGEPPTGINYEELTEPAAAVLQSLVDEGRSVIHDPNLPRVDTRFLGTRAMPDARASIRNLTPWNFDVGHLTLALLSGMIDELHQLFDVLPEDVRAQTRRLCLTGNALRRNPVLRHLAELHFSLPVYLSGYTEEAAVGAALVAGVGSGLWSSYEEASRAVVANNWKTYPGVQSRDGRAAEDSTKS